MKRCVFAALICLWASLASGCATPRYVPGLVSPPVAGPQEVGDSPRDLPMFAGRDGRPISWVDLLQAIAWAEIIIVGEQHDDAMGHAVQRAIVEDTLDRWPRSALSMEMLERNEQILVDDYLDDIIDVETFIRLTFSANWGGEGSWVKWFQPIVDAAKQRGGRVIAANAPRRYVRVARLRGYAALDALPRERRALFDRPRSLPRGPYFERFAEVMAHIENPAALDAMFRSQMVWDATMARSILQARPSRSAKVVHLIGRFHSDFEGGTVQQIRKHRPRSRVLVLSMSPLDEVTLREEDYGRADVVIYTGEQEEPVIDDEPADNDEPTDESDPDHAPVH